MVDHIIILFNFITPRPIAPTRILFKLVDDLTYNKSQPWNEQSDNLLHIIEALHHAKDFEKQNDKMKNHNSKSKTKRIQG